ncbi:MAG: hypothetical protein ACYDCL_12280 [Myxococcales bacterium]
MTEQGPAQVTIPRGVTEIAKSVGLRAIYLAKASASLADHRLGDVAAELSLTWRTGGSRLAGGALIACGVGLDVQVMTPKPEMRKIAALSCDFGLQYEVHDAVVYERLTEQDLAQFAAFNGAFNAWPFIREFVHTTSSRMMLSPPVMLPVFSPNFFPKPAPK